MRGKQGNRRAWGTRPCGGVELSSLHNEPFARCCIMTLNWVSVPFVHTHRVNYSFLCQSCCNSQYNNNILACVIMLQRLLINISGTLPSSLSFVVLHIRFSHVSTQNSSAAQDAYMSSVFTLHTAHFSRWRTVKENSSDVTVVKQCKVSFQSKAIIFTVPFNPSTLFTFVLILPFTLCCVSALCIMIQLLNQLLGTF